MFESNKKALLPLGEKGWDEGSLPLEEREKTGRHSPAATLTPPPLPSRERGFSY